MSYFGKIAIFISLIATVAFGTAHVAKGAIDYPLHTTPKRLAIGAILRVNPWVCVGVNAGDVAWLAEWREKPVVTKSQAYKYGGTVPLNQIPKHFIYATLAIEDRDYFAHYGIFATSITLTIAKNFTIEYDYIRRKFTELLVTLWLETRMTKPEILSKYFDYSYMGEGTIGVEAASQFYFGKSVRNVNLAEAAILAGLFKAPTRYAPHLNLDESRKRAGVVLDAMVVASFITKQEADKARLQIPNVVIVPYRTQNK